MPAPTSRARVTLAGIAVAFTAIAMLAWRDLRKPITAQAAILPPEYARLGDFLTPLADSGRPGTDSGIPAGAIRDPFFTRPIAPPPDPVAAPADSSAIGPDTSSRAERVWTVGAIMPGKRKAAVINDALVYVGESLPGGWRLVAVDDSAVVLTDAKGARHRVMVRPEDGG
jgi:hypothetical protein